MLVVISLLPSCVKHESIPYNTYTRITDKELSGIYFVNGQESYAVGGRTWSAGIIAKTMNAWKQFTIDSVSDKELFCIDGNVQGQVIGMGIELWAYHATKQPIEIQKLKHPGSFRFIRSVSIYNDDLIMAANANGQGTIERFTLSSDSSETVFECRHDLNTIAAIDSLKWIAAGYGIVVFSSDAGTHWDTLDIQGDQFVDLSIPAGAYLFMVGVGGRVYKINKSTLEIEKIRSGGVIGSQAPLKAICFINESEGLIAGEAGKIFLTRNAGDDWITLDDLPEFDVKDIFYDGQFYWLCGSQGTILSLKL